MVNALPKAYSSSYVIALCECLILLLIITLIQFPKDDQVSTENTRSLFLIARQRTFVVSCFVGFVCWSSMAIQMSSAPLAMTGAKHNFNQVILAVQCHLLGMFGPSFLTGSLCNYFGCRLVMFIGLLIELSGTLVFQCGFKEIYFYLGLILIGIGWNFGYVGSSVLLTTTYCPEEKTKTHSLYESIMMIALSISFFSSAFAEQFIGWMNLTGKLISIYLGVAIFIFIIYIVYEFYKTKSIRSQT